MTYNKSYTNKGPSAFTTTVGKEKKQILNPVSTQHKEEEMETNPRGLILPANPV